MWEKSYWYWFRNIITFYGVSQSYRHVFVVLDLKRTVQYLRVSTKMQSAILFLWRVSNWKENLTKLQSVTRCFNLYALHRADRQHGKEKKSCFWKHFSKTSAYSPFLPTVLAHPPTVMQSSKDWMRVGSAFVHNILAVAIWKNVTTFSSHAPCNQHTI